VTLRPESPGASGSVARWAPAAAWLGVALAASAGAVVGAQLWFRTLQRVWPTDDPMLVGLQFGSFLVILGALGSWWWRGDLGLRLGATLLERRRVAGWAAVLSLGAVLLVAVGGPNAYSGSDPLFEVVLVPLGEELVFRGLMLGILLDRLHRWYGPGRGVRLAIVFSALAFGAAHASNALFGVAHSFVVVQVVVATVLGLILADLRVRTRSLLAPVLLHALVNAINLLA
jgi:membrane protease YdiL (CAAX protease family)